MKRYLLLIIQSKPKRLNVEGILDLILLYASNPPNEAKKVAGASSKTPGWKSMKKFGWKLFHLTLLIYK